ncbi:LytTR family DNA-binding domain-containing protein [Adlercreutzia sp. R25]|uniref:LytR/AlgR family response regulator transcription factor n=1 Tax=Adlercreutzia shanghongiae TaxID=3111773 RepID=UPI002DB56BC3|nr:LytTR family DNA-binding domain-containing protein [Adlercreutzia sp. R25]MEC4271908.1 LytTR family DNA-binding domain-containing protein [Adlercreutzia sp. R25]
MDKESRPEDAVIDVAIVDDDENARFRIRQLLQNLAVDMGLGLSLREYPSGMAFMLDPPPTLDLLLTDIDMPHASGLETAAFARSQFGEVAIVLVTAYEEYAVEGYSVQARRYLLKPVGQDRFYREIAPLLQEIATAEADSVVVRLPHGMRVLRIRDILYIATAPKKRVEIKTRTDSFLLRGAISEWENQLPSYRFFRCHSGFLVNMSAVRQVETNELELISSERIPLSKHRRRAFLEFFAAYMGTVL